MKCKIEGCNRDVWANSMCSMHLQRVRRSGSPGEAESRHNSVDLHENKKCKRCGLTRPISQFPLKSTKSSSIHFGKRQSYCEDCYLPHMREVNIASKFNLSVDDYKELCSSGCAICGDTTRLAVDHDHACCPGQKSCGACIRGVLCMRHNLALGNLRDSVDECELLIQYIKGSKRCM